MTYRSLVFCAIGAIAIPVVAQTSFEHADQRTPHVGYSFCTPLATGWAVAGYAYDDDGSTGHAFLVGLGADGDTLWEHPMTYSYAQASVQGLATTGNGDLIACAFLVDCDVLLPLFLSERIAPDGSTVWSHVFHSNDLLAGMAINAGDTLAFSTEYGILSASPAGDSLSFFSTNGTFVEKLIWDTDQTLMTSQWNGSLARWSMDGAMIASGTVAGSVVDMASWRGHRLVLSNTGMLRSLDMDLVVTDSLDLGDGYGYGKLLPVGDLLIAAGGDHLTIIDTALAIISTVPVEPDGDFPSDLFQSFAANDSVVMMTASPNLAGLSAGLVRTIGLDGSHAQHTEDVGISILSMDSVYYQLLNGVIFPKADATVRLTNLGSTVLNDVLVAQNGTSGPACGVYGAHVQVQDAALAPGEHLDVSMIGMELYYAPWDYLTQDQVVCVAALSPDHVYDRDQSNNLACDTAHIILSIGDNGELGRRMVVNNPFGNSIDLLFSAPVPVALRLTLYDATGRSVATTDLPAGGDRFHWPLRLARDGMYLLRVEGFGAPFTRKLMRLGDD